MPWSELAAAAGAAADPEPAGAAAAGALADEAAGAAAEAAEAAGAAGAAADAEEAAAEVPLPPPFPPLGCCAYATSE
jgi:hypothetical protein